MNKQQRVFRILRAAMMLFALWAIEVYAESKVTAARVWPASDYTRITLESSEPLQYNLQMLKDPSRLVLDLKETELNPILKTITDKVLSSDPYIKQIRVAKFKSDVVRVVVDLKQDIRSELFSLNPAGQYKHRLVLDIYPFDPLMSMLADRRTKPVTSPPLQAQTEPKAQPTERLSSPESSAELREIKSSPSVKEVAANSVMESSKSQPTTLDTEPLVKSTSSEVVVKPLEVNETADLAKTNGPSSPTKQPSGLASNPESQSLSSAKSGVQSLERPEVKSELKSEVSTQVNHSERTSLPPSSLAQEPSGGTANKPDSAVNAEAAPKETSTTAAAAESSAENANQTKTQTDVDTSLVNKSDARLITIVIDAGHGGEDPGARGANGSHEKDITLAIAKKLKRKIDAEPTMRGMLTRDGDYFIPLHGRVIKARKLQADLFVSIHADAFSNQSARGSSVFALSEKGATSASARYLAKKENESDLIGGVSLGNKDPELARTLLDLSQTATINDSLKLGKAVLRKIGEINKLHKNHVEQAGFAVLKSPDVPSILVETAFISNPEEERRLNDEAYQDKLVDSILAGIKTYFASNPPLAKTKMASD